MSFFRNPRFIEEINKTALSSRLTYKGYDSEDVASFYNRFGTDILEGMSIYIYLPTELKKVCYYQEKYFQIFQ